MPFIAAYVRNLKVGSGTAESCYSAKPSRPVERHAISPKAIPPTSLLGDARGSYMISQGSGLSDQGAWPLRRASRLQRVLMLTWRRLQRGHPAATGEQVLHEPDPSVLWWALCRILQPGCTHRPVLPETFPHQSERPPPTRMSYESWLPPPGDSFLVSTVDSGFESACSRIASGHDLGPTGIGSRRQTLRQWKHPGEPTRCPARSSCRDSP